MERKINRIEKAGRIGISLILTTVVTGAPRFSFSGGDELKNCVEYSDASVPGARSGEIGSVTFEPGYIDALRKSILDPETIQLDPLTGEWIYKLRSPQTVSSVKIEGYKTVRQEDGTFVYCRK